MSAANIAAMAAALIAMAKQDQEEEDDYEGIDPGVINTSIKLGFIMLLVMVIGTSASLYIALTFGFAWGMVGATITGLLTSAIIFFA